MSRGLDDDPIQKKKTGRRKTSKGVETIIKYDDRDWKKDFETWKTNRDAPMPGAHPNPNHLWNTNRENFM